MRSLLLLIALLPSVVLAGVTSFPYCGINGQFYGRSGGLMGCFSPSNGGGNILGPTPPSVTHDLAAYADTSATALEDTGILSTNLCLLTGNQTVAGIKTLSSAPVLSALTASLPVVTDAGKAAASMSYATFTSNLSAVVGDSGSGGTKGLVPAPGTGDAAAGKFLKADAIFAVPVGSLVGDVFSFTGMMEAPTDKIYVLDQKAAFAYTVNTVDVATVSGTTTLALKINGTNITGCSAVSVSSTPATGTCTAANSVSAGNKLTLVLSSSASPVDMSFTVKYTR